MESSYITNLGYFFIAVSMILTLVAFGFSLHNISTGRKFEPGDYVSKVFIEQTVALFLFAIGAWIIITDDMKKNGINESFFKVLIIWTAAGGIFISSMAVLLSYYITSWKA